MKKLLICALSLILVSCMKVDLEQTFIYSKITVNETNSSYVSNKYKLGSYDDKMEYINRILNARTVYNGSEMLCDLTGKLYMIKSEYKVGTVAIKQDGLICRFEVVEENVKTHNPSDIKIKIYN